MTRFHPESVSLIVHVYNGGEYFARCLACLEALSPHPGDVIVVDDGSYDKSLSIAACEGVRVLQTTHPRSGSAVARNLATAQARGEILFFADADVLLAPDAVARVVNSFGAHPQLAAPYGSYSDKPHAQNFMSQYRNLLHHFVEFAAGLNLKWSHRLSVVLVYLLLINLVLVPRSGISLPLAGLCLVALVAVNRRLYLFFAARRSWRFMLAAILMHFLFYLYNGFAFAVGLVLWLMPQRQKAKG